MEFFSFVFKSKRNVDPILIFAIYVIGVINQKATKSLFAPPCSQTSFQKLPSLVWERKQKSKRSCDPNDKNNIDINSVNNDASKN